MKMIDRIIEDIPLCDIEKEDSEYHNECKYYADTRIILDNLRDYEVEIPLEYFERYGKNYEYNYVLKYMADITDTDINDFKGGNTYNYNGRILHDINYNYIQSGDDFYVVIMVHRLGDIRANYTDYCLLKFDSFEHFFETLDEICIEKFGGYIEHNGKHYYYDMSIFSEMLRVWCEETQEEYEIYISNDDEFKEKIDELESEE